MIELRRMHYFSILAEELHFGRAALRLRIAQSALSAQIQTLESELGARLLTRNKRSSIALTDAGSLFLDEARRTLDQAEHAELVGRRAGRGELGCIEIGYVLSALFGEIFPLLIRDMYRDHPQVEIRIHEMRSSDMMQRLDEGRLDVAFVGARPSYPIDTEALSVEDLEIVIALPADHPVAARFPDAAPAAALADSRFVVVPYNQVGGHERELAAIAERGGFTPASVQRASHIIDALGMVQAGMGVTILPASLRGLRPPGVAFRSLVDVRATFELMAVFHKNEKSPSVAEFIAAVRKAARRVGTEFRGAKLIAATD